MQECLHGVWCHLDCPALTCVLLPLAAAATRVKLHNITEDDVALGHEEYMKFGAGSLKKKTAVTPRNICDKAMLFTEMHLPNGPLRMLNFQQTLHKMFKTGKYYPSGWVAPGAGRGLNHERAAAQWRILNDPANTQPEDIHRCDDVALRLL